MKHHHRIILTCLFLGASVVWGLNPALADPLGTGREAFGKNDVLAALPYFQEAVKEDPADPEALSWLAEALRRTGKPALAAEKAWDALDVDSCYSFAHCVLAELYHNSWPGNRNPSRAWEHAVRAVECGPDDGNAWLTLLPIAIERGDVERENEAIQRLGEIDFFAPGVLAYNRWMLRDVPENAILLVNGDMDTFPALVLQQSEGFRADVAVVSYPMLELRWYRNAIARRHKLPITEFTTSRRQEVEEVSIRKQVVAWWLKRREIGILGRPLVAAVTVPDLEFGDGMVAHFALIGAVNQHELIPPESWIDTTRVRQSLESVDFGEFSQPFLNDADRSPVRGSATNLRNNVVTIAVQYGLNLINNDRIEDARTTIAWAREYSEHAPGRDPVDRVFLGFDFSLAGYYMVREDHVNAEPLFQGILEWLDAHSTSQKEPGYIQVLEGLGTISRDRGDFDTAEMLLTQSLEIRQSAYGTDHPMVADGLDQLGILYHYTEDYDQAIELHREAYEMVDDFYGREHRRTAAAQNNLGYGLLLQGKYAEAEATLNEALATYRKLLDPQDHSLSFVLDSLGDLYLRTERPQEAEPLLAEALEIRKLNLPEGTFGIAYAQSMMGACLIALERYPEAETLLLQSYPTLTERRGLDGKDTQATLERLVTLYESWGKTAKAEGYRKNLIN